MPAHPCAFIPSARLTGTGKSRSPVSTCISAHNKPRVPSRGRFRYGFSDPMAFDGLFSHCPVNCARRPFGTRCRSGPKESVALQSRHLDSPLSPPSRLPIQSHAVWPERLLSGRLRGAIYMARIALPIKLFYPGRPIVGVSSFGPAFSEAASIPPGRASPGGSIPA